MFPNHNNARSDPALRLRPMKTKTAPTRPAQPEIRMPEPEAFALIQQQTTDGERIAREQAQRQADRKTAESNQIPLFI